MKKSILLLAIAFATLEVRGAIVSAEANDDNGFSAALGGDLPVNSLVRVGTFNIPDSTIRENSTNPSFLNQNFAEFGTARIGDGGSPAGLFSRTINNPNSDTLGFAGKQIYLWVFNSTDNSTDSSSFTSAFEQGVFYVEMGTSPTLNPAAPAWRFRDTDDRPNDTTVDLSDLTTANSAVLAEGARVVIGLFPYGVSSSTGAPNFGLVQIPEPGSAALVLASVSAMALRRRRTV